MKDTTVGIDQFLQMEGVCFDVRSPLEFQAGSFSCASNLPLFSDAERAEVGTVYKKVGKQQAIELGVKIVGPKLTDLLECAKSALKSNTHPLCRVYCARGGMRSSFVHWFLNFVGIQGVSLKGGYKAFRRHVLQQFTRLPKKCFVLGGCTGSGKTELLQALKSRKLQALDLEAIALHRGSAFGAIMGKRQPTTEQFENDLGLELSKLDCDVPVWIEDESRLIGSCVIPGSLFSLMQEAPLVLLETEKELRLQRILQEYGSYPTDVLVKSIYKIEKRLGSERTKIAAQACSSGDLEKAVLILLEYYDKMYLHALSKHKGPVIKVRFETQEKTLSILQEYAGV